MEGHSGLTDKILLLDNYGEESGMLHQSFQRAGFTGPVIVIEDDGFFPEDVISVYQYFCGDFSQSDKVPGKARYFNQINVPDYWEISGNNTNGAVKNLNRERGRIFYAEPKHKRLVRVVDWMDEEGKVRSSDHYNRYGALYARTFFSKDAKRFCRAYFDAEGRETIVENYVTHNIILNREGRVYVFHNKVDLVLKLFEELGIMDRGIFFNSLSTPLFVSERMPAGREDVLFWQEGVRSDIPGNMKLILEGRAKRTKTIYVQKRASYEKFKELGVQQEVLKPLGFAYAYARENAFRNEALICTNSDRIEKCEELIQALPQMHFHIAAITEMSSKLMELARYRNVTLYPGIRAGMMEELFNTCDYYLDINHEAEILSAVKQAFLQNQLIVGFKKTLHNKSYIAAEHIFDGHEEMIAFFHQIMGNAEEISRQIDLQKKAAMSEETAAYTELFQ